MMKRTILPAGLFLALATATGPAAAAEDGYWVKVDNIPNCQIWTDSRQDELTAHWAGDCPNGRVAGMGTAVWKFWRGGKWRKIEYVGEMMDGKQHGKGKKTFSDGTTYDGDWVDGRAQGEGVLLLSNGIRHEGGFANDRAEGHGKRIWADGSFYSGGWHNDNMHGRGIFSWPDGNQCVGQYADGILVGVGEGRILGQPERTTCQMIKKRLVIGQGQAQDQGGAQIQQSQ